MENRLDLLAPGTIYFMPWPRDKLSLVALCTPLVALLLVQAVVALYLKRSTVMLVQPLQWMPWHERDKIHI
eukprot:1158687-Pelagomonas_calceolata.AAC.12